ncbi:hypothetical protein HYDPIDRAFT_95007 [Hydnomerulius pinastri MD-312]|uniref:Uncharacterized protein n=1 Tax=Hydnomerulius pinastri MD-312 TaxID=994086 RepID=A0A0C9W5U0_9AGAM|nr:hypothetical protein HYDPIDRAFT_95007 [Hydnomerulius pinastri MD-312]
MEDLVIPGHPYAHGPSYPRHHGAVPDIQENTQRTSKHTHKSSEYAGPHPSAFDPNLPPRTATSDVSMRHRLPPRAPVHLGPISHPYASVLAQAGDQSGRGGSGALPPLPSAAVFAGRDFDPHISISNADFERYGVGEALVYASLPRLEDVMKAKELSLQDTLPPEAEPTRVDKGKARERSPTPQTIVQPHEEGSVGMSEPVFSASPPMPEYSEHMAMPVFDNPDDLDEFHDLFYKPPPRSSPGEGNKEPSVISKGIPSDVRSSRSGSALTNLVRSLSEGISELRDHSRTPSDPMRHQTSESHADQTSSEGGGNYVFLDLARSYASSPVPMESSAVRLPIQQEDEHGVQSSAGVPEDVMSSRASSVLEGTLEETENDTFGYPIRHGLIEAVAPSPVHSPRRASTHLSILEGVEEQADVLSPVASYTTSQPHSADALRSSYMTSTSDNSRMSGLSDFPLPPAHRPIPQPGHMSILQAYFEATPPSSESQGHDQLGSGSRSASLHSHRTTFGGSDDMEFITQVHGSTP